MLIYHSLFDSRLRYGILGWETASNKNISKVRVLQNRAVRFITFASFRSSVAPFYSSLKILPLNEQLLLQRTIFMHSLHYKNLPSAFGTYCEQPDHRYPTRYATTKNYVLPHSTTNRGQRSIKYAGPKAWADVPTQLKDIAFRKPFSKDFKEHILGSIFVELPPKNKGSTTENEDFGLDLNVLFFSTEDEGEFYGFEDSEITESINRRELRRLFRHSDVEQEFFGFESSVSPSI